MLLPACSSKERKRSQFLFFSPLTAPNTAHHLLYTLHKNISMFDKSDAISNLTLLCHCSVVTTSSKYDDIIGPTFVPDLEWDMDPDTNATDSWALPRREFSVTSTVTTVEESTYFAWYLNDMNAAREIEREYEVRKYVKDRTIEARQKNDSVDTSTERLV